MKAAIRALLDGRMSIAEYRGYPLNLYKGWRPLTRESVAVLVGRAAETTDNPAAEAAFKWASEVIKKSGAASDIVLRPDEYLK